MTPTIVRYRPYRPRRPAELRAAAARPALTAGGNAATDAGPFTLGLEEEMFLVDARSLACVEAMPEPFYGAAKARLGERFKREIITSMVEIVTAPHDDLAAAGAELANARRTLAAIAREHGLALLACGTHPFADWREQKLTTKPRYEAVAGSLASLSKRVHICGLHIHVAVPDREMRICVMNRVQRFMPLLLALSTSSPFWRGAPTGLKSYRTAANDESPRTGFPMRFSNADEFERYVAKLVAAGSIPDQSYLWWAIRPSLKYPTLELRIADTCTDWRDTIAVAALYRCLVHALASDPAFGASWENHHHMVNHENRWQAIRHGLGGTMIDAEGGCARPIRQAVAGLVGRLEDSARSLGCLYELESVLAVLERGTSADRQARVYQAALANGASAEEAVRRVARSVALETVAAAA